MTIIETIFLAITQGIAEFLPISSSFHLIFFRDIIGIGDQLLPNQTLAFDVALHFGTLLAIVVYFFKDFISILKDGFTKGLKTTNGKIMWYIVLATIPAAIMGYLFEDTIDNFFRKQYIIMALSLIVVGIIIYLLDLKFKEKNEIKDLTFKDVLIIGFSQALALIPGFSRSGTTIAAGRVTSLKREEAAKFSFYLSVPVVLGATILTLAKDDTLTILRSNVNVFSIGVLTSFLMGIICIKFLLKYLEKNDFKLFMIYRIIIGVLALVLVLV